MLITPQIIKISWSAKNKKYFISKGYVFTKMKDIFDVSIEDLPLGSNTKINVMCDYCKKIYQISYNNYNRSMAKSYTKKYACSSCGPLKVKETTLNKYGVDNVNKLIETRQKIKQTNLTKYGVESASQNELIKEKTKQTCLKKYGVDSHLKTKKVKEKRKQTCLKKYGVDNVSKTKEVKEKIKQTNLTKYGSTCSLNNSIIKKKAKITLINNYGVTNPLQSSIIKEKVKQTNLKKYGVENTFNIPGKFEEGIIKARKTSYKCGNASCSKQQKYLYNLLGGELNYPVSRCSLDIAFPEDMIYIEYNGSGHDLRIKYGMSKEDFKKHEENRKYFLQSLGWKIIKINSNNDLIPEDKQIINLINKAKEYLLNTNHTWIEINIDKNVIECSEFSKKINLNLRYINKGDV